MIVTSTSESPARFLSLRIAGALQN
jgi:hypothetical protein